MLSSRLTPEHTPVSIDTQTFIPVPSIAQTLATCGVESHLIIGADLIDTSLSRLIYRGVEHFHGYRTSQDMSTTIWHELTATLQATRGKRAYISAYLPTLDTLCHLYGATSKQVQSEVRYQFSNLARLITSARTLDSLRDGKTLFIVTADHGHLDVHQKIFNDAPSQRIRSVMRTRTITNDPRMAALHLQPDTLEMVKAELDAHYSDQLHWIESKDAIEAGLFGHEPLHPELRHRLGDILMFAKAGYIFDDPLMSLNMRGMHTGLHEIEMLVPFMVTRF